MASSALRLCGRLLTTATIVLLGFVIWTSFEIRDEVVNPPAPRRVRLTATAEPANAIEYVEGYDAGLRRAAADNRPMLVIFRANWCHWCAEFARGTLVDRRLVGLARQFVCVTVDADRHAADCRRFGVKQFPTVLLATSGGDELRRWTGCPTTAELTTAMSGIAPAARMAGLDEEDPSPTR